MANNGLTVQQHRRLKNLEAAIAQGAADIYESLRTIHDEKLYKASHDTFEAYCVERWGMGKSHAYRLLQHGQVLRLTDETSPIGDISDPETPEKQGFSAKDVLKEAHTREVAGLPKDVQTEILAEAIKQAPTDATGRPVVTTELVREIRGARTEEPVSEDAGDQEDQQENTPRPPGNGKDKPGGSKQRTPAEEYKLKKSKAIKTAEALMREIGDLNAMRKWPEHTKALNACRTIISKVKEL